MLRRTASLLTGPVLLLAAATGCSTNSPEPAGTTPPPTSTPPPAATTSSAPPPTTSPSPVATVSLPAPTFEPEGTFNEDDAIGFSVYYLNVLNYARATGDPALLRSISEPSCRTCTTIAAAVDDYRRRGYIYIDRDVGFESAELRWSDAVKQEADVNLRMVTKDYTVRGPDGSVIYEQKGAINDGLVQMHFRDGRWLIQELPR